MTLSDYEARVRLQIQDRKTAQARLAPARLVPSRVRATGRSVGKRAGQVPGADRAVKAAAATGLVAARGLGAMTRRITQTTLSGERVCKAYKAKGHDVEHLRDIRQLDLEIIEGAVLPRHLDLAYASAAALEGAVAGFAISGGQALLAVGSVAGAGAGAAPGLGAIAGAVGADAAAVLAASTRATAHVAMYYGYDPLLPGEQVYILSIINLSSAVTSGAKMKAYRELSALTQMLARGRTWQVLSQNAITRLTQQFAKAFSVRITQRKLGQFVPVAGIAVGAGMNYQLVNRVIEEARWVYRERFILEKLGEPMFLPEPLPHDASLGEVEAEIDVLQLLEEQAGTEDDDGTDKT